MKIYSTELLIVYDINGDKIQLSLNNILDSTLKLAILDKDFDKNTGETFIEFNNIKELEDTINDFKMKLKLLNVKF